MKEVPKKRIIRRKKIAKKALKSKKTKRARKPSLSALLKKAQTVFNKYIRDRDSIDGRFVCVSCHRNLSISDMNAGHYVPVKGGSFLRFHEWNVNGECIRCNGFDEFHLVGYRQTLLNKIGQEAVKYLEDNRWKVKKWGRSELEEIIKKYA